MIKTKQITTGAMVCAIYGALLFLNQQSALMIESSASWIFAFPVLIYTIKAAIIYIYSFFKNNRIDSIRPKARPVTHRLRHFSNCFI